MSDKDFQKVKIVLVLKSLEVLAIEPGIYIYLR